MLQINITFPCEKTKTGLSFMAANDSEKQGTRAYFSRNFRV